jgi:Fe-S-cluster containining protein
MSVRRDLPAGSFSSWLRRTRAALLVDGVADVPCGDCSACCTTSHFVHVGPEETQTLARIPRALLFPAPDLPAGNVLMGYDEQGCCPMLTCGRCSIYEDRPLTCRTYDCRVFAAAGISADTDLITRRARRWRFDHPTAKDRDEHAAVRAAAKFLRERAECVPGGSGPGGPVSVALLSVKTYEVFLELGEESGANG